MAGQGAARRGESGQGEAKHTALWKLSAAVRHGSARRGEVRPVLAWLDTQPLAKQAAAVWQTSNHTKQNMKTITVKWEGIRPLLMHSWRMIDPDNAHVRKKGELMRQLKKAKKDDVVGKEKIRREIERAEWEGAMYWNPEDGMFCPGENIFACIVAGARKAKCGKQAEQGLIPPKDTQIKTTRSTTNIDTLYEDPAFSLRQAVRIPPKTGTRQMAVRPMIPTGWSITFDLEFDEEVFPEKDLIEAMQDAGALIGLGDWRPKFGRFTVEIL